MAFRVRKASQSFFFISWKQDQDKITWNFNEAFVDFGSLLKRTSQVILNKIQIRKIPQVSKSDDMKAVLQRDVDPPTTPYYVAHISPPVAPEPPTWSASTSQGAVVRIHLYYSRPAAAKHRWQRVMPGRQLSKHCPVRGTATAAAQWKKCANSPSFFVTKEEKHTRRKQKAFMCMYHFNYTTVETFLTRSCSVMVTMMFRMCVSGRTKSGAFKFIPPPLFC